MHLPTGQEVRRVQIDAKFTHEVVRAGDRVYVCDTGNGRILELAFPDMTLVREWGPYKGGGALGAVQEAVQEGHRWRGAGEVGVAGR
jgi:hypothetical protein